MEWVRMVRGRPDGGGMVCSGPRWCGSGLMVEAWCGVDWASMVGCGVGSKLQLCREKN